MVITRSTDLIHIQTSLTEIQKDSSQLSTYDFLIMKLFKMTITHETMCVFIYLF